MFFNRKKKSVEAYQAELLETHYQEVESMYQDMRSWRHNYRNHLQTLLSYAQEDDLAGIKEYICQLEDDLESIAPVLRTGNKMLDAILNSKISRAQKNGVEVVCHAKVSLALTTPDLDLCTIIGNLFDNALEAVMELEEEDRFIRIYLALKNTQLYLSFTNSTAKAKQKKVGRRFLSDKGVHRGLGLESVEKIVDRLEGYMSVNSEEGAFTAEILLPQDYSSQKEGPSSQS